MKCTKNNKESLNLNAKYCFECRNKSKNKKHFCNKCGRIILYEAKYCCKCIKKLNYKYNRYGDSKSNVHTKDNKEELKKKTKDIIIKKDNNGGDFVNMENNITQKNYLEILPNQNIIENKKENLLPVIRHDKSLLLPVIIEKKELALIEIKQEYQKLKEHKTALALLNFAKAVILTLAKFTRICFLTIASIIGFVGVAVLIIASTAIITKNIVNSYYGITPEPDTTYSIFKMKDDKINAQSPPKN